MDKALPLVSVIVPLYNREKFLPQLFDTLTEQTYQTFELILIDDGSTDDSEAWLKEHSYKLTQNIVYRKQNNSGPYSARNYGLSLASGKYIAFQDSDDEWPDYHLQEMVGDLEANSDIDWLFGSLTRIDHETREVVEKTNFYPMGGGRQAFLNLITEDRDRGRIKVINDAKAGEVAISDAVPGSTQCALIRAEVFNQHKFDESFRTAYDRFFAIKLVLLGYKFAYVEKCHQVYHIHDSHISLVVNSSPEKLERSARTMLRGYLEMKSLARTKPEIRAANKRLAQVYAWELAISQQRQAKYFCSTKSFIQAIKLVPHQFIFYKSMLASLIKGVLFKSFGVKYDS